MFLTILLIVYSPAGAIPLPTHCAPDEQVIFSCALEEPGKTVSLCATAELTADNVYLQYRYGHPGQAEMQLPESRENSLTQFTYNAYSRFQFSLTEVAFRQDDMNYLIYDYYNGEDDPAERSIGLRIQDAEFNCAGIIVNDMYKLENILACNPDSDNIGCDEE